MTSSLKTQSAIAKHGEKRPLSSKGSPKYSRNNWQGVDLPRPPSLKLIDDKFFFQLISGNNLDDAGGKHNHTFHLDPRAANISKSKENCSLGDKECRVSDKLHIPVSLHVRKQEIELVQRKLPRYPSQTHLSEPTFYPLASCAESETEEQNPQPCFLLCEEDQAIAEIEITPCDLPEDSLPRYPSQTHLSEPTFYPLASCAESETEEQNPQPCLLQCEEDQAIAEIEITPCDLPKDRQQTIQPILLQTDGQDARTEIKISSCNLPKLEKQEIDTSLVQKEEDDTTTEIEIASCDLSETQKQEIQSSMELLEENGVTIEDDDDTTEIEESDDTTEIEEGDDTTEIEVASSEHSETEQAIKPLLVQAKEDDSTAEDDGRIQKPRVDGYQRISKECSRPIFKEQEAYVDEINEVRNNLRHFEAASCDASETGEQEIPLPLSPVVEVASCELSETHEQEFEQSLVLAEDDYTTTEIEVASCDLSEKQGQEVAASVEQVDGDDTATEIEIVCLEDEEEFPFESDYFDYTEVDVEVEAEIDQIDPDHIDEEMINEMKLIHSRNSSNKVERSLVDGINKARSYVSSFASITFSEEPYEPKIGVVRPAVQAMIIQARMELRCRKVPEEHKKKFKPTLAGASSIGRATRLDEHTVEARGRKFVKYDPLVLPSTVWVKGGETVSLPNFHDPTRTKFRIFKEAVALGGIKALKPEITTNYDRFLPTTTYTDDYEIDVDDETKHKYMRVKYLTDIYLHQDYMPSANDDEDDDLDPVTYESLDDVKLPTDECPVCIPVPERITMSKFKELISQQVAEKVWERRYRLERPRAKQRIKDSCNCKYCRTSSPFQTFAYRKKWLIQQNLWNEAPVDHQAKESDLKPESYRTASTVKLSSEDSSRHTSSESEEGDRSVDISVSMESTSNPENTPGSFRRVPDGNKDEFDREEQSEDMGGSPPNVPSIIIPAGSMPAGNKDNSDAKGTNIFIPDGPMPRKNCSKSPNALRDSIPDAAIFEEKRWQKVKGKTKFMKELQSLFRV